MAGELDTREERIAALRDARARTLSLLEDLDDARWFGPELAIVNPPIWELGHVAWFQEKWCLRELHGRAPLRPEFDALYDSAAVAHDTRWRLAFPDRRATLAWVAAVLDEVERATLARHATPRGEEAERYFQCLALFHEDMHGEAFVYTRQTHGYAPPPGSAPHAPGGGPCAGDVELAGGAFELGARPGSGLGFDGFVFDNEQWAHAVAVAPFRMARAPVTQAEFRTFVAEEGYARRELWSAEGWRWREHERALHPLHWRLEGKDWLRRRYDRWVPLEPHLPVHFVNAHEAEAYCRWAGRRLPSEAEWELAAGRARFPWGDAAPSAAHACLDLRSDEPCEVGAHAAGDTPAGLRQLTGNVWEWTATPFGPYPGFAPGPYAEYSAPWFGDHRVLRGGAFATRARLLRNTWRNFYTPDRRDVLAGFRTCALE
jgi:ergothioneine biosynthesis protein EgtB